jgi:hypothetical protein
MPGQPRWFCAPSIRLYLGNTEFTEELYIANSISRARPLLRPDFIRPQRLFTVEHQVVLYSVGKVTAAKFDEVFKKTRALLID